jgi:hypothetical protein
VPTLSIALLLLCQVHTGCKMFPSEHQRVRSQFVVGHLSFNPTAAILSLKIKHTLAVRILPEAQVHLLLALNPNHAIGSCSGSCTPPDSE